MSFSKRISIVVVNCFNSWIAEIKSKNVIFCCLFFIFIYGCVNKKESTDFLNAEIRTVESRRYDEELFISFCMDMAIVNSHFLITYDGAGRGALVARESDGNTIGPLGSRGQGPGEYITPSYAGKSINGDTIYLHDIAKQEMLIYKIDNFGDTLEWHYINKIERPQNNGFYDQIRRLKNGYYVGLRIEAEAKQQQILTLLDAQLNEVKTFAASPITLERDYVDYKICYGNARISVYENSVFFAVNSFGYISGYDISDTGDITTRFEEMLVEPSYQNSGRVVFNSENRRGFSDIAVSKNYIFALYVGKAQDELKPDGSGWAPETFAVFNHDGKLISRIKLNNKAFRLTVSEDEERLYFCSQNPEFVIEEYQLSDLIK
ncbi:MAG: TolB-like 6-bladed beta-propeller domain-containing protein [Bacteroidales bacterium]|jgi:hypothetical protein|nr:TolB-like 6-bladed beta-propeller domain-containing protein [Bacteroidales bacterium]